MRIMAIPRMVHGPYDHSALRVDGESDLGSELILCPVLSLGHAVDLWLVKAVDMTWSTGLLDQYPLHAGDEILMDPATIIPDFTAEIAQKRACYGAQPSGRSCRLLLGLWEIAGSQFHDLPFDDPSVTSAKDYAFSGRQREDGLGNLPVELMVTWGRDVFFLDGAVDDDHLGLHGALVLMVLNGPSENGLHAFRSNSFAELSQFAGVAWSFPCHGLVATEVLPVDVLAEFLHGLLIAEVTHLSEDQQANHHPYGNRRSTNWRIQR